VEGGGNNTSDAIRVLAPNTHLATISTYVVVFFIIVIVIIIIIIIINIITINIIIPSP
jgi:hypothetical protein